MSDYWNINSYDYFLPEEQIAQHPSEKRGESKLLVYSKFSKKIKHSIFKNIIEYLKPGDLRNSSYSQRKTRKMVCNG